MFAYKLKWAYMRDQMAKFISQIKLFIILTILTIPIGLNSVVGADGVPFATDPDINQMPNATYTYA